MRLPIVLALSMLVVALVFPAHSLPVVLPGNPPTTGSTLFFDDFTAPQGFPVQWNVLTTRPGNQLFVTQAGGLLYVIPNQTGGFPGSFVNVFANASINPLIGTLKPESVKFLQIVYRMQPFNATNPSLTSGGPSLFFNTRFGLSAGTTLNVYFSIYESTQNLNTLPTGMNASGNFPAQRSAIFLNINTPMASATTTDFTEAPGSGIGTNPGMLYNTPGGPIDPNIFHTFTIQMQIDNGTSANSYVRFQVDNNGWMGYNQVACSCITGPSGDVRSLYPWIQVADGAGPTATGVLNQHVSAITDWVLATDYVPASLPQGQFLTCASVNACIPRAIGTPQPTFGGGTLTIGQFMQQEALSLDHTNIYSGGLALTGIISTIALVGFGMAAAKARLSVRIFGFVYVLFVTILSIFGYIVSIVPIWLPIVTVSLVIAMFAGVIRGVPAGGGVVPD